MIKRGYCYYFNGIDKKECEAGYNYLEVARPLNRQEIYWHNENYSDSDVERTAIVKRIPCKAINKVDCKGYREPTFGEILESKEKHERWFVKIMGQTNRTRAVIIDYIKQNNALNSDFSGQIPCPICKEGQVNFTYAGAYNQHIHARCDSSSCVQWME